MRKLQDVGCYALGFNSVLGEWFVDFGMPSIRCEYKIRMYCTDFLNAWVHVMRVGLRQNGRSRFRINASGVRESGLSSQGITFALPYAHDHVQSIPSKG